MTYLNAMTSLENIPDIKGIVFDCDGVLFDSMDSNRTYYNAIRARLGLSPMNAEEEAYVHSHTVRESLFFIVPQKMWGEIDRVRREVDYVEEILPHLRPEPGLYDLLQRLRDNGYLLGISTNRSNTMSWVVERFGLKKYFKPVIHAGIVQAKPHPEGMNKIMQMWRVSPERIAFVGDSDLDQGSARAAGVHFWAYKNPSLQADLHINDFWSMAQGLRLGASFTNGRRSCRS